MPTQEKYEILILGSGTGGKLLAWQAAKAGRRTAVVERQWIGGSCPNIACMPSKSEIWSARAAHHARNAARFGTTAENVVVDMAAVRKRKREMVDNEVAAHRQNYASSGAELIMGSGRFIAPKTLEVRVSDGGTRQLTGDRMFLNVGTHAAIPDVAGLAAARPLTHIEALELDRLPPHLVVLGGGYVGLEMAQAYRRFGSRVTVIEPGPQIMGREDPDVAQEMQRILAEEGIEFLISSRPLSVKGRSGEEVRIRLETSSGEREIDGSDILVAAGRVPNTEGIGLDIAGVEVNERGYVRVNERLETTAAGVWAIGECAGSPQFTHASADDFRIIWANLAGGNRTTRDRLVPYCMFTDPPLAHVGLSEAEATRQRIGTRIARLPISAVLRAHTTGEQKGFMKVLVGADDDRILGFTMIGAEAGEVMTAVQTAMLAGLPYMRLSDAVIAHLTMAEGLGFLLPGVPPRSEKRSMSKTAA
jgi:pyruvate/2-oxoglutarate dehydrogenase complex dihydrolipoamide dehydrogenase (E3) component